MDKPLAKGVCDENRQVNRVYTYGTLTKQGMAETYKTLVSLTRFVYFLT
ncbi:hypothetical protein GH882_11220 [Bacillus thuringiensis]|nr:hypothetical protein [Bacillus thuringiensis]